MKKEIEFECDNCWDLKKHNHLKFKTDDWYSGTRGIYDGGSEIVYIETLCPKCKKVVYKYYNINELLEMIFELQEKIIEASTK